MPLFSSLGDIGKVISDSVVNRHKALAVEFHAGVVNATPVDLGDAQRSWEVNLGAKESIVKSESPYMERLNNGHSKQAPVNFIEDEIDRVIR